MRPAMTDRGAAEDRDAERTESIEHDGVVGDAQITEDDAGDLIKPARAEKLGEHPVDPVGRLVDLLQQQDRRLGGSRLDAHVRGEHAQIAADQDPGGAAVDQRPSTRQLLAS